VSPSKKMPIDEELEHKTYSLKAGNTRVLFPFDDGFYPKVYSNTLDDDFKFAVNALITINGSYRFSFGLKKP